LGRRAIPAGLEPEVVGTTLREPEAVAPPVLTHDRPGLWPCPKCGEPAPVAYAKAGGSNVHGVACRRCGHRGREMATAALAQVSWDKASEAVARAHERRALSARRKAAGGLRRDPTFVALVLERHLGRGPLEEGGRDHQIMKAPVDGVERRMNVRAFVDWLVPQWPNLETLRDPEAVVHRVLHDAGRGFHDVTAREYHGRDVGRWRRTTPVVGAPADA
jgi:hypothetical protein